MVVGIVATVAVVAAAAGSRRPHFAVVHLVAIKMIQSSIVGLLSCSAAFKTVARAFAQLFVQHSN